MTGLRNSAWGYVVACGAVAAAALTRGYAVDGQFGRQFPFLAFLFATLFAAWVGGPKPGLLSIVLGVVSSYVFFDHQRPGDSQLLGHLRVAMFALIGGLASYWIGRIGAQQQRIAAEMRIRRQAERALVEREQRVRLAVESADIGTWDLNVLTGERQWSNRSKAMFGLPLDEDVSKLSFVDLLHPDDRQRTSQAISAALDPGGAGRYEIDYRTVWSDGTTRWVVAKGQAFFEGEGIRRRAVRFIGTVLDITEGKVLEEESKKHQEVLELAHNIGQIGHWEWNSSTDENKWSPEIEKLYGLPPGGFKGGYESWTRLIHPDDLPKAKKDVRRAMETGEFLTEFRVVWPDQSVHWLETRAKVFLDGQNGQNGPMRIIGVSMDVTDRKRLEEELRSINRDLAKADRHKDEFLATLAHELRNPLAPISNGLQYWPSVAGDRTRSEQLRSMMERQVRQMTRLIDDLTDVSRITSGKIVLHKERVDLHTVITAAVESVQSVVDAGGHRLTVSMPAKGILVDGDAARLAQVFGNILNNAAKFTGRDGTISLRAERQGEMVVVRIQDDGPGIPQHMLSEIFETFRQVDATIERSHGGLGIGLTLVKRLTEMHGGTVEARSAGPGTGSEFAVTLPALADQEEGNTDGKHRAPEETPSIAQHRILIVDDLPEVAESLQTLLEVIGQEVLMAHDGATAIETALMDKPDIVFLDIAMPGMNGYEVARQLRGRPELNGITLVALTGYGQVEDQRRAAEAGFNHHLTKPTSLAKLEELLMSVPAQDEAAKNRMLSSSV